MSSGPDLVNLLLFSSPCPPSASAEKGVCVMEHYLSAVGVMEICQRGLGVVRRAATYSINPGKNRRGEGGMGGTDAETDRRMRGLFHPVSTRGRSAAKAGR